MVLKVMISMGEEKYYDLLAAALRADPRSQDDLAKLIGCARSFGSMVKNGERNPGRFYRRMAEIPGYDANTMNRKYRWNHFFI